jgi:hypothetical protein
VPEAGGCNAHEGTDLCGDIGAQIGGLNTSMQMIVFDVFIKVAHG